MMTSKNNTFIALTALWAFVESGLGGMMHAFHLPFTGIFLGGFSVLIISLIAHFEKKPFHNIMKATLIVMTIKLTVNPMTSPFAYLAVGFQGVCGALIYSLPFRNLLFSILFAVLAMLESAFQKLLILTVFLGKTWWKALDAYYQSICKIFAFESDSPFGLYVVLFYLLIYFLWGLLLGLWAFQLPIQLKSRQNLYAELKPSENIVKKGKKSKSKNTLLWLILSISLIVLTFFISDEQPFMKTGLLILRTVLVLIIWVFLLMPLARVGIEKWLKSKNQSEMPVVLQLIPMISSYVRPLQIEVSKQYSGFKKWKEFVLGLIIISLKQDGKLQ